MEKKFYSEKNFFLLKKTFFTEKNINENVKNYISFHKYIFTKKITNKIKMFLKYIYSFCKKKKKKINKNIFVKISL